MQLTTCRHQFVVGRATPDGVTHSAVLRLFKLSQVIRTAASHCGANFNQGMRARTTASAYMRACGRHVSTRLAISRYAEATHASGRRPPLRSMVWHVSAWHQSQRPTSVGSAACQQHISHYHILFSARHGALASPTACLSRACRRCQYSVLSLDGGISDGAVGATTQRMSVVHV